MAYIRDLTLPTDLTHIFQAYFAATGQSYGYPRTSKTNLREMDLRCESVKIWKYNKPKMKSYVFLWDILYIVLYIYIVFSGCHYDICCST